MKKRTRSNKANNNSDSEGAKMNLTPLLENFLQNISADRESYKLAAESEKAAIIWRKDGKYRQSKKWLSTFDAIKQAKKKLRKEKPDSIVVLSAFLRPVYMGSYNNKGELVEAELHKYLGGSESLNIYVNGELGCSEQSEEMMVAAFLCACR